MLPMEWAPTAGEMGIQTRETKEDQSEDGEIRILLFRYEKKRRIVKVRRHFDIRTSASGTDRTCRSFME